MDTATLTDGLTVDADAIAEAMEYYAQQGWTDGLPVVPATESSLAASRPTKYVASVAVTYPKTVKL